MPETRKYGRTDERSSRGGEAHVPKPICNTGKGRKGRKIGSNVTMINGENTEPNTEKGSPRFFPRQWRKKDVS
jgi:hypothetical protein